MKDFAELYELLEAEGFRIFYGLPVIDIRFSLEGALPSGQGFYFRRYLSQCYLKVYDSAEQDQEGHLIDQPIAWEDELAIAEDETKLPGVAVIEGQLRELLDRYAKAQPASEKR